MILCVTANPALDRSLVIPGFTTGRIFRPDNLLVAAGGKGINVARALRGLGGEAVCAGFLAGYNGRLLAELAEREGLPGVWTWIEGETRICTILADPDGDVTVVNENGPVVTAADWERLADDVTRESARAEAVCFSGSLPPGSPPTAFAGLIQALCESGRAVWVDTSGKALTAALTVPGASIKVNGDEAGEVLGRTIVDASSAADAAGDLQARGQGMVTLTLGAAGAVLARNGQRWHAQPPPLKVVSPVGSGDSFLAGMALAFAQGHAPDEALRRAVAAGTANALTVGGGSFSRVDFERVLAGTTVRAV
ncbi:MAG: 1-phosphofructokinase family hexose kinase [Chloroflexi bacterium]|nr:1-phosphofructokinase family hexose kinase [Chloroflexota bacterium]